jgi:hypothetical protein
MCVYWCSGFKECDTGLHVAVTHFLWLATLRNLYLIAKNILAYVAHTRAGPLHHVDVACAGLHGTIQRHVFLRHGRFSSLGKVYPAGLSEIRCKSPSLRFRRNA